MQVEGLDAMDVLGHRAAIEIECPDHVLHPRREAIDKLEFKNHSLDVWGNAASWHGKPLPKIEFLSVELAVRR